MRAWTIGLLLCAAAQWVGASESTPTPNHGFPCVAGMADGYPCSKVDLASRISLQTMGATGGSSLWGWTDPDTQREYGLMGLNNGTAFVDISNASHPVYLGKLPAASTSSIWRELKTYGYYAYIVSEASGHGMQVFDLRRLRNVANAPVTFTADFVYTKFTRAHNIVINQASGFAYATGIREAAVLADRCGAGLHMMSLANPAQPTFADCFAADGYTHDALCVNYNGPDAQYVGHEICFAANEDTLTIVDVSNKASPVQVARVVDPYPGVSYLHQGWLSEDGRFFAINDELDEQDTGSNTRTFFMDVSDLDAPVLHTTFTGALPNIDHNLFIKGQHVFQANYRAGLRVLDMSRIDEHVVTEAAWFDTFPSSNSASFNGAWNVYPFFASGHVILSDIESGLFVLKPDLCPSLPVPDAPQLLGTGSNSVELGFAAPPAGMSIDVLRRFDGCAGVASEVASGVLGSAFTDTGASGQVPLGYALRYRSTASPQCVSVASSCVPVTTTGACTAPPAFSGITSALPLAESDCAITTGWPGASSRCGGSPRYRVERSPGLQFDPGQATILAPALSTTTYVDGDIPSRQPWSYRVSAFDSGSSVLDGNQVALSAFAVGTIGDGHFHAGAEPGDPAFFATSPSATGMGESRALPTPNHVAWEPSSSAAAAGEHSYYSGNGRAECLALESADLQITPGQSASLSLQQRYDLTAGSDAGLVQVSTDGGANWQNLIPVGGYPAVMSAVGNQCGIGVGTTVFSGNALGWQPVTFDLSAYSGSIRLRFLFSSGPNSTSSGWWIDEIDIAHVQVPGDCTLSTLLLRDGFEGP
jgi:choice-of-anchor B domain-containing protein